MAHSQPPQEGTQYDRREAMEAPSRDHYGFVKEDGSDRYYFVELPPNVVREREKKWLEVLSDWENWNQRKRHKVKQLCRKGIPSSLRHQVWMRLSGAERLMKNNVGVYKELVAAEGEKDNLECIKKDIPRTFADHEYFQTQQGRDNLYNVLKAVSIYKKDVGYASGMSFLAAVLLLNTPAEDSFWLMVTLLDSYLLEYFKVENSHAGLQVDAQVLEDLLLQHLPEVHRHLKLIHFDPLLICSEWFLCLFTRSLPWSCMLRIWDMFWAEGNRVKFRVALALLKLLFGKKRQRDKADGFYEVSQRLHHPTIFECHEDILIPESLKFHLMEEDIKRLWKKRREGLPVRTLPSRRATFCGATNRSDFNN